MASYHIRRASLSEIPFLVKTIIEAKKSNTDRLGLANVLHCSEDDLKGFLSDMLEEEIDGCELSVSSFLIAEYEGQPVAAVAGWIEGFEENLSSSMLKSNLLSFTIPRANLQHFKTYAPVLQGMKIPREAGSLQIEYVFVEAAHRGKQLAAQLIQEHIKQAQDKKAELSLLQVQVFQNNVAAIRAYQKLGFTISQAFVSSHPEAKNMLPGDAKILLELTLTSHEQNRDFRQNQTHHH